MQRVSISINRSVNKSRNSIQFADRIGESDPDSRLVVLAPDDLLEETPLVAGVEHDEVGVGVATILRGVEPGHLVGDVLVTVRFIRRPSIAEVAQVQHV